MAGATANQVSSSYDWPSLTSDQQRLLLQALSSNDRRLNMDEFRSFHDQPSDNSLSVADSVDPHVFEPASMSPPQPHGRPPTFGDGFLPDFSNGHTTDFDVELPQDLVDGLSGFASGESGEKRKSSEDDDIEDGDAKRHENGDKAPKKPGRKPLMAEPTTKRKAQNRAAQRAFRERKEQHLKDLETKISDLTNASETANHENSILRAQVNRLQDELKNYKKRLSSSGGIGSGSPPSNRFGVYNDPINGSSNPFDFAFQGSGQFDKSVSPVTRPERGSMSSPSSNANFIKRESTSRSNSTSWSPESVLHDLSSPNSRSPPNGNLFNLEPSAGPATSGLTPGFFEVSQNNYGFPHFGSPSPMANNQTINAEAAKTAFGGESRGSSGSVSSHAPSPSTTSSWRNGTSSSCGTSPEPWNESNDKTNAAQQQNATKVQLGNLAEFQFDPTLFGGYRETQDAIFGDGDFSGGLYDDFLNIPDTHAQFEDEQTSSHKNTDPVSTKPNLMEQVARQREGLGDDDLHVTEEGEKRQMMTCHKIFQELQKCPKYQDGELDIDGLCSELSKKATCSESGANIPKDEWEAALWRMVGQPGGAKTDRPTGESARTTGKSSSIGVPGLGPVGRENGQMPDKTFESLLNRATSY